MEVIHFNELKRLVSGISCTVLAGRLSELEHEGPVNKSNGARSSSRELGKWVMRWKGAKSSPKLTAKNVKNLLPLLSSIWI